MKLPPYRKLPTAINVAVYDMQGDPLSSALMIRIEDAVERVVNASDINSLVVTSSRE